MILSVFTLKIGILRDTDALLVPADDEWAVNHQTVIPNTYRLEILS